jgi:hypothetical protein
MPIAAKSPAGSSLRSVVRLRRRIFAFKRFGILNPLLRHAPPRGLALVVAYNLGHALAFGRKSQEGV